MCGAAIRAAHPVKQLAQRDVDGAVVQVLLGRTSKTEAKPCERLGVPADGAERDRPQIAGMFETVIADMRRPGKRDQLEPDPVVRSFQRL